MRLHVDGWDPSYGTGMEAGDSTSDAVQDLDVERPADRWAPLDPAPAARAPRDVLFVDGVRRLDASVWVVDDDGAAHAGLCSSYAAGAVRCGDGEARVVGQVVERGLFSPSPAAVDVELPGTCRVVYRAITVGGDDPDAPRLAVQDQLRRLEIDVAETAREEASADRDGELHDDDLLVVDGPLHGRTHLPRALGYVKSHERRYLRPPQEAVVVALQPGQRTPAFLLGSSWQRYAWYLRLPCPPGAPWAGVVRVECSADLPVAAAVELADRSAVTLPRFASRAFREPRAPQNLVPVGGLERLLRARLGDARLLRRNLRAAAARTAGTPGPAPGPAPVTART